MNSSRWLNERALFAISRATIRPQAAQRPLTRNFSILQPAYRTTIPAPRTQCLRIVHACRTAPSRLPTRKFWTNSSKFSSNPTPYLGSPKPTPSLSQRLRKLSREYGWSALGVYFMLSALDFPFCFLAVRLLGTERIGRWEHAVIGTFWDLLRIPFPDYVNNRQAVKAAEGPAEPESESVVASERGGTVGWSSGMAQAQADNVGINASMLPLTPIQFHATNTDFTRSLDTARTCLRHPQILYLYPSPAHRSRYTKGCQNSSRMGLGHWQENTQAKVILIPGKVPSLILAEWITPQLPLYHI
jgi:hypothetical protein